MKISVPYTVEDSAIFMRMLRHEHGCEFVTVYTKAAEADAAYMLECEKLARITPLPVPERRRPVRHPLLRVRDRL